MYESYDGGGPSIGLVIFGIIIGIIQLVSLWRLYEKAGEPGWAILIPFYNLYTLLKIINRSGWQMLILIVPIVNAIFAIIWTYEFAKSYTESRGIAIASIFFPYIVFPILGFGKAVYLRKKEL